MLDKLSQEPPWNQLQYSGLPLLALHRLTVVNLVYNTLILIDDLVYT